MGMIMRRLTYFIILVWACTVWCGIPDVYAEQLPSIEADAEQKRKIAILPQSVPIYFYKDVPFSANIDVMAMRRALNRHAQTHPYLEVISAADIEAAWRNADLHQTDAAMQAEIDMGYAQTFMANMNFSAAMNLLRRVIENYQKGLVQFYRQSAVAQAWQQLAYAYIAQYQESPETRLDLLHPARQAFIELIRLAPHITMLEGRQSPERVALYDEALELFLGSSAYRQTQQNDAAVLANRLGVDILLLARVVQNRQGQLMLEIDEYQADSRKMQYHSIALTLPDDMNRHTQAAVDTATLLLNRIYSCLKVVPEIVDETKDEKRHKYALEIGGVYNVFAQHPTNQASHGIGGHISFMYMFDAHFFIRAGIEIIEMMQDKAHELYKGFEIYQFPVVAGISKQWDWFRLYGGIGLNFSFSAPHIIVKSTACKTFGLDDIECRPEDVTKNQDPFSLQVAFVMGVNMGAKSFYASIEGVGYVTAYPTENKAFKHPLGFRLALQYWF